MPLSVRLLAPRFVFAAKRLGPLPAALAISTRIPIYLYIGRFARPRAIRGIPTPKAIPVDVDDFDGLEGVIAEATAVDRRV